MTILGSGVDAIKVICKQNNLLKVQQDICHISLDKITIGEYQPRLSPINDDSIAYLIESIKEHGVLQPIIVQYVNSTSYKLVAGERRFRAAKAAGLIEIPCVIKKINDVSAQSIAIIENIQREQLSVFEEAEALSKLKNKFHLNSSDVSKILGRPRTTVTNLLRAAEQLCQRGKELWGNNIVDYGHVRAVITLHQSLQEQVLEQIVNNQMSVRKTEEYVREKKYLENKTERIEYPKIILEKNKIEDLKQIITQYLKYPVNLKQMKSGKLIISVDFDKKQKSYD